MDKYSFTGGNSASGIDLPRINVDIKVTSVRQPRSSCPFKSAGQKIYGRIVFVYEKFDDADLKTGRLGMKHTIFIEKERTGVLVRRGSQFFRGCTPLCVSESFYYP